MKSEGNVDANSSVKLDYSSDDFDFTGAQELQDYRVFRKESISLLLFDDEEGTTSGNEWDQPGELELHQDGGYASSSFYSDDTSATSVSSCNPTQDVFFQPLIKDSSHNVGMINVGVVQQPRRVSHHQSEDERRYQTVASLLPALGEPTRSSSLRIKTEEDSGGTRLPQNNSVDNQDIKKYKRKRTSSMDLIRGFILETKGKAKPSTYYSSSVCNSMVADAPPWNHRSGSKRERALSLEFYDTLMVPTMAKGIPLPPSRPPKLVVEGALRPPLTVLPVQAGSLSTGVAPAPAAATSAGGRRIGAYSPAARQEMLARFRAKRQRRVWRKRVKYGCRQQLAAARPRVKGRFIRKEEEPALLLQPPPAPHCGGGAPPLLTAATPPGPCPATPQQCSVVTDCHPRPLFAGYGLAGGGVSATSRALPPPAAHFPEAGAPLTCERVVRPQEQYRLLQLPSASGVPLPAAGGGAGNLLVGHSPSRLRSSFSAAAEKPMMMGRPALFSGGVAF